MSITILIPTALRQFTDEQSEIHAEANTVAAALSELTAKFPDIQKHLFTEQNTLRNFVNIYVNEDNIRQKNGLETALAPNDTIMIVPSIAGGSPAVAEALDNSVCRN